MQNSDERNILTGIVTEEDVKLNQRRDEKLKLDILEAGFGCCPTEAVSEV